MALGTERFLIVDDNPDGRVLLARTLMRKFPRAVLFQADSVQHAVATLQSEPISVVLAHRANGHAADSLVALLRAANSTVPILALSGIDRSEKAILAGANRFLLFDQWLMAGKIVEELLSSTDDGARGI